MMAENKADSLAASLNTYVFIVYFPKHHHHFQRRLLTIHRDQNFGLNELAAIQDVRNEFNLQDNVLQTDDPPPSSSSASSSATNDRGEYFSWCTIA